MSRIRTAETCAKESLERKYPGLDFSTFSMEQLEVLDLIPPTGDFNSPTGYFDETCLLSFLNKNGYPERKVSILGFLMGCDSKCCDLFNIFLGDVINYQGRAEGVFTMKILSHSCFKLLADNICQYNHSAFVNVRLSLSVSSQSI